MRKEPVSALRGSVILIPRFLRVFTAGIIISSSSYPKMPFSPAWGFSAQRANFGLEIPHFQPEMSLFLILFSTIKSLSSCISLRARWRVKSKTLKSFEINIISALESFYFLKISARFPFVLNICTP